MLCVFVTADPNIVRFLGASLQQHQTLLVMEYMPNGDLFRRIAADETGELRWYQKYASLFCAVDGPHKYTSISVTQCLHCVTCPTQLIRQACAMHMLLALLGDCNKLYLTYRIERAACLGL